MKDNKKYLMILTDLKMGGVTTSAVNFCNVLSEHGAQVEILLMSDCCKQNEFILKLNEFLF